MQNKKIKLNFFNKKTLCVIGILLIFVLAAALLWQGNVKSHQAMPTTPAQVYFVGQYRIGDGEWQDVIEGEHISATKGDVTLRGNFHLKTPNGDYWKPCPKGTLLAFYVDHINLSFYEEGKNPYVIGHENPLYGQSACGIDWTAHAFSNVEQPIEIVIHNPHNFGNENAVDQMLSNMAIWSGIDFEKGVLDSGETQRNTGLLFVISSLIFLGIALFSSLIHVKNSKVIWLLGLVILFAGLYFTYKSFGISFWNESVFTNTTILGGAMMLYMFFICTIIVSSFKVIKKAGTIISVGLGFVIAALFVLSMATSLFFYDTWHVWVIIQSIANIALIVCLIKELICANKTDKFIYVGGFFPLISFTIDSVATWIGVWEGGLVSRYVFIILFIVAMIVLIRIIPNSINALAKTKELEREKLILNTQLTESRVSTMMSQIRPHFIYNTLGSIEQLCELDPPKAGELVHNFAKYLRGNFGELDNPKPILMSQEMQHVRHYINIESVRFPDMNFTFEINSNDFYLPALTVQPIVENAIKHGLMKLQKGGTIKVVSFETDESYCVTVEDDGVGFDTTVLIDERKHVGLRNISGRLKAMVNGTLEIESTVNKGTKVLITIPKGESK